MLCQLEIFNFLNSLSSWILEFLNALPFCSFSDNQHWTCKAVSVPSLQIALCPDGFI